MDPENKIDSSLEKFSNLIQKAPVAVTLFRGPSFIIETVNKTSLEILGKSYEEVINKPLFEVSPEMEDTLKTLFNTIYDTGETFTSNETEVQLKRAGKKYTAFFNLIYQPWRDEDNKICGIISIGTEVTDAVEARVQLAKGEAFNRTILERGLALRMNMFIKFLNSFNACTIGMSIREQELVWRL